ncbi:MAG: glycosyltransferase family 9 protein [Deltaproteobacteria bacterium]|nr:glycosyltransferase family 9 protein [Deltaproteobacteria bacterium]
MELANKKILMVRLGAIGDVIRTLPALRALRASFPEAYIGWVVEDRAASILKGHPDLNKVFVVSRKEWEKSRLSFKTLKEVWKFIRNLRKENFDMVLDFHGLFKSGVITLLSGVRNRVGFSRKFSKEGNFLFTNRHVSLPGGKMNRVERNLFLVKSLGLEIADRDPIIPISDGDREFADPIIPPEELSSINPRIIVHPGSSPQTLYKRWDYRRFAQLADILIRKYGGEIFFTAGKDEREIVNSVIEEMTESQYVCCRTETLTQLAEIIRRSDLYIGNDTAPMHLAAFVGTPVIGLFGPTDPIENAPYGKEESIVIRKDVSCNPCRNRECPNLICMDAITVEDVLESVERVFLNRGFTPKSEVRSQEI